MLGLQMAKSIDTASTYVDLVSVAEGVCVRGAKKSDGEAFLLSWAAGMPMFFFFLELPLRGVFSPGFFSCPDLGKKVVTVCVFQWIPEVPRRWLN